MAKNSGSGVRLAGFKHFGSTTYKLCNCELVTFWVCFPISISYLFLHDKSPQNVVAYNKSLLPHSVYVSGMKWVNWLVLACGIHWVYRLHVCWGCRHLTAGLGLGDLLPRRLTQDWPGAADCWQDASVRHMGLSTGCLSSCTAGSPRGHKAEATVSFMTWPQKSHCHFCSLLLVTQVSPTDRGRGLSTCSGSHWGPFWRLTVISAVQWAS